MKKTLRQNSVRKANGVWRTPGVWSCWACYQTFKKSLFKKRKEKRGVEV